MTRLITLLPLLMVLACDPFNTGNSSVDEANEQYEAGDHEAAVETYEQATEEIPERPELHFDIGTNLLAMGQFEDAETAFSRALEEAQDELRPLIFANLGLARLKAALAETDEAARKELFTKAMDSLQQAVLLRPDLQPARQNLELALLHLFPPCHKREDIFEPNDQPGEEKPLDEVGSEALILCPGNTDLFARELETGDRFQIKLRQTGNAETSPPNLEIMDSSGAIVGIGQVEGQTSESNIVAAMKGAYQVRFTATDGEEHPYQLETETLPSCERLEDEFEDNDELATAASFPAPAAAAEGQPAQPPTAQIRICPADDDWFEVRLQPNESLLVQLSYEPVEGDLQLTLHDGSGGLLSQGQGGDNAKKEDGKESSGEKKKALMATVLDVRTAQTIYIKVSGTASDSEGAGTLTAMVFPPCPEGDDQLEDNDDRSAAHDLTPSPPTEPAGAPLPANPGSGPPPATGGAMPGQQQGAAPIEHLLRRCPGDDDWFSLALKKDDARQIQIGFEHDKGDLSLSLYKDEEETAAMTSDTSSPEQGGEGLALQADADAMYYLHITGPAEASNFYMLRVETPEPKQGDGDNQDDEEEQQDEEDQKKEQKQEQEQEQEQQKPIEQMMDHLDRQKQPNLEAEKALRAMPNVQAPGGKVW